MVKIQLISSKNQGTSTSNRWFITHVWGVKCTCLPSLDKNLRIKKLDINNLLIVSQLIEQFFNGSVASTFNDEGIDISKKGFSVESLEKDLIQKEYLWFVVMKKYRRWRNAR